MRKLLFSMLLIILAFNLHATKVRFETTVGDIEIDLYDVEAPVTVENFLNYVNRGDYDETVIHRSVPGFVFQGGAFRYSGSSSFQTVSTDSPIVNEYQIPNTEGTIAMARLPGANTATNQWFFNLTDNTSILDPSSTDAGFAVFGKVTKGLEVLKLIESFFRINFSSSNLGQVTNEFPIFGFFSGSAVTLENTVKINRAYVLSEQFQITPGLSGAWFNPDTNGQGIYLEVLPSVNTLIMAWFAFDTEHPDASVPSTIGAAGNRWLTASGDFQGNQFVGSVFKTSGGLFDNPVAVSNTNIGDITLTFINCAMAEMSYVLDDSELTNTINIQRISGSNVDFCEQLSIEADQGVITQQ
ncbi:Peptidyl-prolyl cis-trans isomerase PpiB [hydrothermal vent metagenome]|uniref:peptidylprolyl isomerase n=1 Tax=hydrothermal vent metagenome TaxID=652676 RepID=A0A3B0VNP8_9ZZZZ